MIYKAIDRWNSPDSYLEHHGVKGMKWGVRKQIKRAGRAVSGAAYKSLRTVGKGIIKTQGYMYNRGKKLDKYGTGRFTSSMEGLSGFSAARAASGFRAMAKASYVMERSSGVLSKPSNLTVGMAAASVALSTYGAVVMSKSIVDSASVNFYRNHKNDRRFAGSGSTRKRRK